MTYTRPDRSLSHTKCSSTSLLFACVLSTAITATAADGGDGAEEGDEADEAAAAEIIFAEELYL